MASYDPIWIMTFLMPQVTFKFLIIEVPNVKFNFVLIILPFLTNN